MCCFLSLLSPLFLISPCWGARGAGKPLPGLRTSGISGDKYPLPSYEPYGKRDCLQLSLFNMDRLMFCKSGILIFIFAENNYLVRQYICPTMLIKTPLLRQSLGPCVFLSFSLSPSLFLADSLERKSKLHNPGNISLFPSFTFSSSTPDHQVLVH